MKANKIEITRTFDWRYIVTLTSAKGIVTFVRDNEQGVEELINKALNQDMITFVDYEANLKHRE